MQPLDGAAPQREGLRVRETHALTNRNSLQGLKTEPLNSKNWFKKQKQNKGTITKQVKILILRKETFATFYLGLEAKTSEVEISQVASWRTEGKVNKLKQFSVKLLLSLFLTAQSWESGTFFVPYLEDFFIQPRCWINTVVKRRLWGTIWPKSQSDLVAFFLAVMDSLPYNLFLYLGRDYFNDDSPKILCFYVRSFKERIDDHWDFHSWSSEAKI